MKNLFLDLRYSQVTYRYSHTRGDLNCFIFGHLGFIYIYALYFPPPTHLIEQPIYHYHQEAKLLKTYWFCVDVDAK
jgi:hypothetical protein